MSQYRLIAATALALTLGAPAALATPDCTSAEPTACAACRVQASSGGQSNVRAPAAVAGNAIIAQSAQAQADGPYEHKKTGPPAYVSLWRLTDLPAGIRRASIGYVVDDRLPRVVTWGEGDRVEVLNVSGERPVVEASAEVGATGASMAVVRRPTGRLASIVVPGAVFVMEGGRLVRRPVPDIKGVHGAVRFADGTENVFFIDGAGVLTWAINPAAERMVTAGREMVTPDQASGVFADLWARLPQEVMAMIGWPDEVAKSEVLGLLDVRGDSKAYAWVPVARPAGNYLVFADAMQMMFGTMPRPVWQSPRLAGRVLDVASGMDPKGGRKRGLLLLMATGEEGKGRTLEFLALD
ncbi:MAG TPA: hypothetical protein VLH79_11950 [Chthonomonadales bacterium]|nr:hypothetical protein [Chthonomonadales bacterium]